MSTEKEQKRKNIREHISKRVAYPIIVLYIGFIIFALYGLQRFYFEKKDHNFYLASQYRDEIQESPNDYEAIANLGKTYHDIAVERKSRFYLNLAERQFEKAVKLAPENISYKYALALVYKDQNEIEKAKEEFQKILKLDEQNVYANYELAMLAMDEGFYLKSIKYLEECLKIEPTSATIIYQLGLSYEKNNQPKQAIQQYKDALRFIPDYKEALEGLERLNATEK
jgi:tetratricopeptide (TPR) repeat protein